MTWQILSVDCRDAMSLVIASDSVDAIVTDPPYELGFMGKKWDSSGVAFDVDTWRAAFDVLKPGGHLLAFSGTRTYHRMVCAIEDAGFEIRDQMAWVYGSGFPKSLDVTKELDKLDAAEERKRRAFRFTAWMCSTGITAAQINHATNTEMGNHYTTHPTQPSIATLDMFERIRHLLPEPPAEIMEMMRERTVESENFKAREVVGQRRVKTAGGATSLLSGCKDPNVTAAHTELAKRWQGWGTALKPAWEPICVARKPLTGTMAANIVAHGVGPLNIDACRVGDEARRWPANLVHDGSDEVLAFFPDAKGQQGEVTGDEPSAKTSATFGKFDTRAPAKPRGDGGSAARFFYCAKASKADRGEGNDHPTVKPTALMRYLCKLVTPPGGLVLDPFTGSGSTGVAAVSEGFRFVGTELSAAYAAIARRRIEDALASRERAAA